MRQFQSTLQKRIELTGYGVHSGDPSRLCLNPAEANHGIVFIYQDGEGREHRLKAHAKNAGPTELCTTLTDGTIRVETIEHLMAAIAGFGLDNLAIEVTSKEVPILDGSALCFIKAFEQAGIVKQHAKRRYIRVGDEVKVAAKAGYAKFYPADTTRFEIKIEFPTPIIGVEEIGFDLTPCQFAKDIACARTFGFLRDVEYLWAHGLALGSSLENSIVIGQDDQIINKAGLHYPDEFVRHKALDAIGDTALLGLPFIGVFESYRGGHNLNAQAVKKLLDTPDAFDVVEY